MGDLRSPAALKLKGGLFLLLGGLSAALLLVETPTLRHATLLAIAVWSFCRFYYFAFYVLHHYVDPSYRYAGLTSLIRYLLNRQRG